MALTGLDEIDGQVARFAFSEISKRRGRYAANRTLSTLNTILKLAVDAGYRSSSAPNPIADVKRNREVRSRSGPRLGSLMHLPEGHPCGKAFVPDSGF